MSDVDHLTALTPQARFLLLLPSAILRIFREHNDASDAECILRAANEAKSALSSLGHVDDNGDTSVEELESTGAMVLRRFSPATVEEDECFPLRCVVGTLAALSLLPDIQSEKNSSNRVEKWRGEDTPRQVHRYAIVTLGKFLAFSKFSTVVELEAIMWATHTSGVVAASVQPGAGIVVSPGQALDFILFWLPVLERVLSNSLRLLMNADPPKKLSLMLQTPEMLSLFPQPLIAVLRAVVGPLHGLNLRNVSAHGFISSVTSPRLDGAESITDELDPRWAGIVWKLIVAVASRLDQFDWGTVVGGSELSPFNEFSPLPEQFSLQHESCSDALAATGLLEFDSTFWADDLSRVIEVSPFGCNATVGIWEHILAIFAQPDLPALDSIRAISLSFPLLEHILRRIFVIANDCTDRWLTATTDQLYLTLDGILAHEVQGQPNKLFEVLGGANSGLVQLIFDLLAWSEPCPRIRDAVMHGMLDFGAGVPRSFVACLFCLAVGLLCVPFAPLDDRENTELIRATSGSQFLSSSLDFVRHYSSQHYHPACVLAEKYARILRVLNETREFLDSAVLPQFAGERQQAGFDHDHTSVCLRVQQHCRVVLRTLDRPRARQLSCSKSCPIPKGTAALWATAERALSSCECLCKTLRVRAQALSSVLMAPSNSRKRHLSRFDGFCAFVPVLFDALDVGITALAVSVEAGGVEFPVVRILNTFSSIESVMKLHQWGRCVAILAAFFNLDLGDEYYIRASISRTEQEKFAVF